jgi:hypothetical protein
MINDKAKFTDEIIARRIHETALEEELGLKGAGVALLFDEDGELKQRVEFDNLITQVGDQYYGERAAGIASPPGQVTGMRLGTGATAVAKTGAGAAIVTYKAGSQKAIDGGFPTSALSGASRRIAWQATWGAGVATQDGLNEVVITNESPITDVAGSAANTIARALLNPVVNKGANDTLVVLWNHDALGA